jgi:hypothetical protein
LSAIVAACWRAPAGREESAASRRGLCDLRTRCEESAASQRGLYDPSRTMRPLSTSERDAERARRADGDYSTSERDAKRARRADAYYATSEGDAKRARRADGDQKKCSNPILLADSFSLPVNAVGKLRRLRSENLDCVVYSVAMAQY